MRNPVLALALFGAAACQLPFQEEYSPLLPDDRLLILTDSGPSQARSAGEESHYADMLAELTDRTNAGLEEVVGLIDTITALPPSYNSGGEVVWGPVTAEGVSGQLFIEERDDGGLDWGIQVRLPDADEDDWGDALLGRVDAGATPETSSGSFAMDFGVAEAILETLGQGQAVSGALTVEYALSDAGVVTDVTFDGITADGVDPQDGTVHFEHTPGAGGLMDVVVEEDVAGTATDAPETIDARLRWDAEGAGRTDARVSGGDLTEQATETECWTAQHTIVFYEHTHRDERSGDETACVFGEPSFRTP